MIKDIKINLIINLIELNLLIDLFNIEDRLILLRIEKIKNNLLLMNSINNSLDMDIIKDINKINDYNKSQLKNFIEKNLKILLYDKI